MLQVLRLCLLGVLAFSAAGQEPSTHDAWPEWRGGSAQGYSTAQRLPTHLDPGGPTMQWKVPVRGQGISSPIVVDRRVFVTTAHRYEGGLLLLKSSAIVSLSQRSLSSRARSCC